jgi:hypothetical protein
VRQPRTVPAVRAGRGSAVLAGIGIVAGVVLAALILTQAAWPVLGPVLTQRSALPAAQRSTDAGIPVPGSAERCPGPGSSAAGTVRWCLPAGVSAAAVARWYDRALPPGRDSGPLRWCVEQYRSNGSRLELWSVESGLVGYQLPPEPPHHATGVVGDAMAVSVVTLPGTTCPAAARASRRHA